jgi:hypothetical protein
MLIALPINSDATLNNFEKIDEHEFVPGENRVLVWQLWNDERDQRYIPPGTSVVKVTFNLADGTTLQKTATFVDAGDRSLFTVTLSQTETLTLVSGNATFSVDVLGDQTNMKLGVIYNGLRRLDTTAG